MTSSTDRPSVQGYPMRDPSPQAVDPAGRSPLGTFARIGLIGFNLVMLLFVLLPLIIVRALDNPTTEQVIAGFIGSALLLGSAFSFWIMVNIALAVILWLARR